MDVEFGNIELTESNENFDVKLCNINHLPNGKLLLECKLNRIGTSWHDFSHKFSFIDVENMKFSKTQLAEIRSKLTKIDFKGDPKTSIELRDNLFYASQKSKSAPVKVWKHEDIRPILMLIYENNVKRIEITKNHQLKYELEFADEDLFESESLQYLKNFEHKNVNLSGYRFCIFICDRAQVPTKASIENERFLNNTIFVKRDRVNRNRIFFEVYKENFESKCFNFVVQLSELNTSSNKYLQAFVDSLHDDSRKRSRE